ncbi:MAG: hypothetical protein H7A09_01710 [Oceanospirillaceae bacterium]|nr:hypothetical protein [Oceanospirillaceae bacterium]
MDINTSMSNVASTLYSAKQTNAQPVAQAPQEDDYPGILHRDYLVKTGEEGDAIITVASPTTKVSLQAWQDAQQYVGFQQHGSDSASQIRLLDDDKATVDFTRDQSLSYLEISSVKGVTDPDKLQQLNEQLIDSKLNPGSELSVFSGGQTEGKLKLEYGVAEFSPSMMYKQDGATYAANNSANRNNVATNEFNVSASITLPSGNSVNLTFSYTEELEQPHYSWSKGAFETFEEYNARIKRDEMQEPVSKSDYRSLAIQYASGRPLSEADAKDLDKINQFLMSMAKSAGNGQLNTQSAGLDRMLDQVQTFGVDMKMTATYTGYAQGDTDIALALIGDTRDVSVKTDTVLPVNQKTVIKEFW